MVKIYLSFVDIIITHSIFHAVTSFIFPRVLTSLFKWTDWAEQKQPLQHQQTLCGVREPALLPSDLTSLFIYLFILQDKLWPYYF